MIFLSFVRIYSIFLFLVCIVIFTRTLQNEHPLVYSEIVRKYCEDHAHRIVWKD
jgi:hypothetical protein